ncbi:hypothetical protein AAG570_010844 [Ranatra chinensis]|uniref:Uncharacterized protein n=1 Tax=Ranatra chinensis TaxID=642074 RepID=A0ABD0YJ62_9HEMI
MASKCRNMFYKNKKQVTTEIGGRDEALVEFYPGCKQCRSIRQGSGRYGLVIYVRTALGFAQLSADKKRGVRCFYLAGEFVLPRRVVRFGRRARGRVAPPGSQSPLPPGALHGLLMLQSAFNPKLQLAGQHQIPDSVHGIQETLKPGWNINVGADNRLYYSKTGLQTGVGVMPDGVQFCVGAPAPRIRRDSIASCGNGQKIAPSLKFISRGTVQFDAGEAISFLCRNIVSGHWGSNVQLVDPIPIEVTRAPYSSSTQYVPSDRGAG